MITRTPECDRFDALVGAPERQMSDDGYAFVAEHLAACEWHQAEDEADEIRLEILLNGCLDEIQTERIRDRADLGDLERELQAATNLAVETFLGDGALALVRRDGRKVGIVYPGRVVFHESASTEDKIAVGASLARYHLRVK